MSIRPALLAAAALLGLAACHRDEAPPAAPATAPAAQAPVPAPPPAAAPAQAAATPPVSADERRRKLREEKDGEAQAVRSPEYEGASSAATALPSQGDDAPAPAGGDTPAQASPPAPPPGQPPG